MPAKISLEKRAATAQIVLEKRGLPKPPVVRVAEALDISGSAKHLYMSGEIQEVHERVMGIAQKFDDNGEVDTWTFTESFDYVGTAEVAAYDTFIQEEILDSDAVTKWHGTAYHPVIKDITRFFFHARPEEPVPTPTGFLFKLFGAKDPLPQVVEEQDITTPVWVLFLTDGEVTREDQIRATRAFTESSNCPIYWSLIGVGNPRDFVYLQDVAQKLDNVGFMHLHDLKDTTDEQIYNQLITPELVDWLSSHK